MVNSKLLILLRAKILNLREEHKQREEILQVEHHQIRMHLGQSIGAEESDLLELQIEEQGVEALHQEYVEFLIEVVEEEQCRPEED